MQDDFNLNLIDWSSQRSHNVLAVGLANCVYLWNTCSSKGSHVVQPATVHSKAMGLTSQAIQQDVPSITQFGGHLSHDVADRFGNSGSLPAFLPDQVQKLKQPSVLTLAESIKGIVRGKLDQFRRCFEVQLAAGSLHLIS